MPDLGVFIKREDRDEVIFSTLLTKNDGLLLQMIQDRIHISEEKAAILLKHYVNEIYSQLGTVGKFTIKGFGVLVKRNDDIAFIYSGDKNVEIIYRQRMADAVKPEKPAQNTPSATGTQTGIPAERSNATPTQYADVPQTPKNDTPEQGNRPGTGNVASAGTADRSGNQQNDSGKTAPATKNSAPQAGQSGNERRPVMRTGKRAMSPKGKQADMVLIVALVAAVIAIGIILYGHFALRHPAELNLDQPETEQVIELPATEEATDTAAK